MQMPAPATRPWIVAFLLYAAVLFIGTHWPQLAIPMAGRPDLVVHMTIFGGWTVLLFVSGLAGPPSQWRAVAVAQLIGVLYAAVDESLQAVPFVRRHFDWDDMMFNVFGVCAATLINIRLRALFDRRSAAGR